MRPEWQRAAERGDAAALQSLLETGEEVDSLDRYGQTALMLAARNGHLEAVRILVGAGADLDRTAKYRLSALMLATLNDRESIVEVLLEAGADTRIAATGAPGFHGKTALDLAEELGRESIAGLLRGAPR